MAESKDFSAEHARTAAETDADVGMEHIADVYAEALLAAAENANCTTAVLAELDEIVDGVLMRWPKFQDVLAAGFISHEEKTSLIDRVFTPVVSPLVANFLKVVARHDRLDCLRAIHRQVWRRWDEKCGRTPVQLTTAAPISDEQADRLAGELASSLGAEPVLNRTVDPELIGGAVIRVGDTVYDGSVVNQLKVLREQMIDRSVHEIQSRRNRFGDSAGN